MSSPDSLPAGGEALVLRETRAGVTRLMLNRPRQRNSLSTGLMAALSDALADVARDPATKCVVLAGAGPAFCAGHDLREIQERRNDADRGRAFFDAIMRQCAEIMTAIVRLPQPVIAEVHGVATAAGCQLVASCDLAVAAADAHFATPGVNIGLFCSTPMVALSRGVARKPALEMLFTGDLIDAETALRHGLVNRVVAPDRLADVTADLAARIASKPSAVVRLGKAAFVRQLEMPLDAAYAYAARVMVENLLMADAAEGMAAFLDKRAPRWQDM